MFTFPACHFSGDVFLDSIISSVCCDLDATIAASFTSGQTWANLIASPANGDSRTQFDFFLGADGSASTDDPTFNGSAGDPAAFFSTDGGDKFVLKGSTTFFDDLHKTTGGTDWWIAVAFSAQNEAQSQAVWGNIIGAAGEGVEFLRRALASDSTRINVDRANARTGNTFDTDRYTDGTDYLVIVSYQTSTDDITIWRNSITAFGTDTDASTGTSSIAPSATFTLMTRGDGSLAMENGGRFYHFSTGNEFIDDTKATAIIRHLETRHNRDYTPPWNLRSVVFNNTFDTSSENTISAGMFLRADGLKLYVIDFGTDKVYQYTLSTAWDISTASFDAKSFSVTSENTQPQGVFFKTDGTKMYQNGGAVTFQYSLSTAWDISTASYDSKSLNTSAQSNSRDLFIKPDGTELYIAGPTGSAVYQYTLSTPWDISTGSFTGSFSVTTEENSIVDVYFKDDDGTKMFIVGLTNDTVYQYTLSTPWDVTSASYDSVSFSVAAKSTTPQGLFFKDDGAALYIIDSTNDIYAFDVG